MEYQYEVINNGQLYFGQYPHEGKTVIIVHGMTGNHLHLRHFMEAFKGHYHVVAIDLKGRGESSDAPVDSSVNQHAEDVLALIGKLGVRQPILVGHSLGAYIVSLVAKQIDCSGLILLDGGASGTKEQRAAIEPAISRMKKTYATMEAYMEESAAFYASLGVDFDTVLQEICAAEVRRVNGRIASMYRERLVMQDLDSLKDFRVKEVFKEIQCPIFVVHAVGENGEQPMVYKRQDFSNMLVSAKNIHKVETLANHYSLILERQAVLNKEILQFMSQL